MLKTILVSAFVSIAILAAASQSPLQASSGDLEIRIKEKATVRGDTITLGAIATFHPGDDFRVGRLKGIEVASAPAPGNEFRFQSRFLDYKIGSAIANEKDEITLTTPDSIVVRRTAQTVSAQQMKSIFKDYVLDSTSWPADRLTFERINTPEALALPEGNLNWEVEGRGNPQRLGNISTSVSFLVDGEMIRKVSVSGRVSVRRSVIKAARRIRKGDVIDRGDITRVSVNSTRINGDAVTELDAVVGKRAVQSLSSGRVLTSRMVDDPPLIRKGNRVVIRAAKSTILITAIGQAMEDGKPGEQVRVKNTGSGKEILATVRGPGLVEVTF
jgi:flagella basal body P-ring formation protein FlgA